MQLTFLGPPTFPGAFHDQFSLLSLICVTASHLDNFIIWINLVKFITFLKIKPRNFSIPHSYQLRLYLFHSQQYLVKSLSTSCFNSTNLSIQVGQPLLTSLLKQFFLKLPAAGLEEDGVGVSRPRGTSEAEHIVSEALWARPPNSRAR